MISPIREEVRRHLQVVFLVSVITTFCIFQGGATAPTIFFFLSPLLSAYLFFGLKSANIYATLCFMIITGLLILNLTDSSLIKYMEFDSEIPEKLIQFMVFIGVSFEIIWTINRYEEAQTTFLKEIKIQHEEIISQEEELRQQQEELITTKEHENQLVKAEVNQQKLEKEKLLAKTELLEIQDALKYASKIQQTMLPDKSRLDDFFDEHAVFYRPKDLVSGDFYFVNDYGKTSLVVLGDCTGHGISASLLSIVIMSYFEGLPFLPELPSELLSDLHEILLHRLNQSFDTRYSQNDGAELTVIYMTDKHIQYSSAKGKLLKVNEKGVKILPSTNRSVGGYLRSNRAFENHSITLSPDDVMVMYTDGYPDQQLKDGGKVGKVAFGKLCEDFYRKYGKDWLKTLNNFAEDNFLEKQRDDITVFCFNKN
ncbi:PP2C family protein-serine/threonine phosphatase [Flammeovirga aprica]|uniref:SpoIIE family protein phosphatase n=1 Tax=Flammeovirga aprica JL-4 TaxID=694437 RepID=A0A7X9RW30_9BACT|nr:SpoIIE family protein phosphatase [Flammeovirga aprica]NME69781.1 SpoIIE family protein phosphatase [Flammeovirga aprica JL-4]